MDDNELFEQARRRVQKKIKGRCVTNKDVIVDQEREIEYYRAFSSQTPPIFLVVPPEGCRRIVAPDWAQKKSMNQEGRGQGTSFERMT